MPFFINFISISLIIRLLFIKILFSVTSKTVQLSNRHAAFMKNFYERNVFEFLKLLTNVIWEWRYMTNYTPLIYHRLCLLIITANPRMRFALIPCWIYPPHRILSLQLRRYQKEVSKFCYGRGFLEVPLPFASLPNSTCIRTQAGFELKPPLLQNE